MEALKYIKQASDLSPDDVYVFDRKQDIHSLSTRRDDAPQQVGEFPQISKTLFYVFLNFK